MLNPFELLFDLSSTEFTSGEDLARARGVSRMAVWKAVQRLVEQGVPVDAVRGRGYRLADGIELLEEARILASLGADVAAVLDELQLVPSVDSTNAYLARTVSCGEETRMAVLAEHQGAGRGRRGRRWESPFGANIYLSLRWQFQLPAASLALLSLAAASELAAVLEAEGLSGHGVKWPNDLLWRDRKLGGLLLELSGEQQGPCAVVIGLGLNWRMPQASSRQIDQPWVDLVTAFGGDAEGRNHLAGRALAALVRACLRFESQGFEAFVEQWERFDLMRGRDINVHIGDAVRQGCALGIDDKGRLAVDFDGSVDYFTSGEVSVRRTT